MILLSEKIIESSAYMKFKQYFKISSLEELNDTVGKCEGDIIFVAGATDIMVKARKRDWYKDCSLIDISEVGELSYICEKNDEIHIGALTSVKDILESEIINNKLSIIAQAASTLAGPQVRAKATIGGNLANSCLAGDLIPALCVLDAEMELFSSNGSRRMKVSDLLKPCVACLNHEEMSVGGCFYGKPCGKKNNLTAGEIIKDIIIKTPKSDDRFFFQKIGRKSDGCMSKFTLSVKLDAKENYVNDLKISIGAAFSDINNCEDIVKKYIGREISREDILNLAAELSDKIASQVKILNDNMKYKSIVCKRLVNRTLCEMIFSDCR